MCSDHTLNGKISKMVLFLSQSEDNKMQHTRRFELYARVLSKFGVAGVVMQSLENAKCYFRLSLIFRALGWATHRKFCLFFFCL